MANVWTSYNLWLSVVALKQQLLNYVPRKVPGIPRINFSYDIIHYDKGIKIIFYKQSKSRNSFYSHVISYISMSWNVTSNLYVAGEKRCVCDQWKCDSIVITNIIWMTSPINNVSRSTVWMKVNSNKCTQILYVI